MSAETRIRAALELGRRRDAAAVPGLVRRLDDIRLDVRKAIVSALGRIGDKAAVPALCAVVSAGADAELRRMAADALGQIADPGAIATLAEGLRGEERGLSFSCAYALGRIGAPALDVLIQAVEQGSPQTRRAAATVLGQIPGERTLATLRALLASPDPSLRLSAAENLGQLGCQDAAADIVALMTDPNPTVRLGVPRVLMALGTAAAQPLCSVLALDTQTITRKDGQGKAVAISLGPIHEAAIGVLMNLSGPEAVRPLVLASRFYYGSRANPAREQLQKQLELAPCRKELFRIVAEGSPRERELALTALIAALRSGPSRSGDRARRNGGPDKAVWKDVADNAAVLVGALKAQEAGVRRLAAMALCTVGDARGKDLLLADLRRTLERLRTAAAEPPASTNHKGKDSSGAELVDRAEEELAALRPLADKAMADQLLPLLDNKALEEWVPDSVACGVVRIMEGAADPSYFDPLFNLLINKVGRRSSLRQPVIRALGAVGDKRAFDPIRKLLKGWPNDSYFADIRLIAYRSMLQCDRERAYEALGDLLLEIRAHVISQIEGMADLFAEFPDRRAVPPLVYWINHDIDTTQKAVRETLIALGQKDLAWLIEGFETESSSKRSSLAGVIADGFGAKVLPELLKAARDERPRIRQGAVWALGCLGGEQAVAVIRAALNDQQAGVRAAAAWSVGNLKERSLFEPLLALLKDADAGPRSMAAQQLGALEDRAAVAPLMAALKDEDPQVRAYAAISLGNLGAQEAVPVLKDLLSHEKDPDVKKGFEFAVLALTQPQPQPQPQPQRQP